ncbi:MAG: sulfatase-like hydrolase/transferase [Acidobacteria bacterium]|nr:sulfatase-like hydrolase/transferase [Acidobacteriota bacterium]
MEYTRSPRFGRHPGGLALLLAIFLLLMVACVPADSDRRMILITIDSVRADRLVAYGASTSIMPRLDQMAAGGTVLTEAWTPAPLTMPALAGMLTGRVPSSVGIVDDEGSILSGDSPRLATRLLAGGWATGMFVNAPFMDETSGLNEGFRRVVNPASASHTRSRSAPFLFSEALEFLDLHRKVPTFAWIHVHDTHYPYLGGGASGSVEERYDAALAAADAALATFLDGLSSRGLMTDAWIVVTADHGEALGDGGERTHGQTLSPSVLHVPLVVQAPGNENPRRLDQPVSLLDLAPTLTDLAGLALTSAGGPLDGRSQAAYLRAGEGSGDPDRPLYSESYIPFFSYHLPPLRQVRRGGVPQAAVAGEAGVPAAPDLGPEPFLALDEREHAALLAASSHTSALLAARRFDEALASLSEWPAAARNTPMAGRLEAAIRRGQGRPDEAILALQRIAAAAGPCADLWSALAGLQDELGRPSAAAWQRAADGAGTRIDFKLRLARHLLMEGHPDQAILAARAAASGQATSATLNMALGQIFLDSGQPEEAQRLLAAAATHSPGSSTTYRTLSRAALATDSPEGALTLLEEALLIDPQDRLVEKEMGDLHAQAGRLPEARAAWRKSLPGKVSEPGATLTIAEQFLRLGLYDEAAVEVESVRVITPDDPQAYYIMGQVALARSDPARADEELLAALRTGGEQPAIYYGLAQAALMKDDETGALAYLDKVFTANEPALRSALQAQLLLTSGKEYPAVRAAVEKYLAGAALPATTTSATDPATP